MTLRKALLVLALLAIPASAIAQTTQPGPATVTGTWTGTLTLMKDGKPVDEDPIHAVLKEAAGVVTGTAGPSLERQYEVTKGKVATVKGVRSLTFEVSVNGGTLLIQFDLKQTAGELTGTAKGEQNGEKMEGTVVLKPAK